MNEITLFEVRRDALPTFRWTAEVRPQARKPSEVLLAIERFAFTSNNVTYAAYGDRLKYWDFFPAQAGWGRIPVWAYLRALESQVDGIAMGDRFYGYAPMASHLLVEADRAGPKGFVDAAASRQAMSPVYNRYSRATPGATAEQEALDMLLRPLFLTSFLLFEFLVAEHFFEAKRLVISSASSKTAYGAAWLLAQQGGVELVGLTSSRNRAFVEGLGCYGRTLSYEQLESLPADDKTVYVDFSGGRGLLERVHQHFKQLVHSCTVGGTQWDALDDGAPLPGPKPKLFFAAPLMTKGGQGLQERMSKAWTVFCTALLDPAHPLMQIDSRSGPAAVEAIYTEMLAGSMPADRGYLLSLA